MARARVLTPRERVQYRAAQALGALPPKLQVRLSGKPPVTIERDTLAPAMQLWLAVLERRNLPRLETLPPEAARADRRRQAAIYGGRPVQVGAVRDLLLETVAGELAARHYAPAERAEQPALLVYY
ncbi:MAG TPA: hypothetical protein VH115_01545, partial [Solirubrobacteraceae bacterium]|nr:hypothetical protein [Solirubrobacteraceae bacterium]